MAGATIKLDGDNSSLNSKTDQSKEKIKGLGDAAGKSLTDGFTKGEIALGKFMAKAFLAKKILDKIVNVGLEIDDRKAATAEQYGKQRLAADTAAQQAGLDKGAGERILAAQGTSSAEERISGIQAIASNPALRYATNKKVQEQVQILAASGLLRPDEIERAMLSGDVAGLRKIVAQRQANQSKDARQEYGVQRNIATADKQGFSPDIVKEGDRVRVGDAYGRADERANPELYSVAGGVDGPIARSIARERGKAISGEGQTVEALKKAIRESKPVNYSAGKDGH
jgi:hypothetical protein